MYSIAHGFLNGLVKTFWSIVARPKNTHLRVGDDIRVSEDEKADIRVRTKHLHGTTCFTSALPDLIKCDLSVICMTFGDLNVGACTRLICKSDLQLSSTYDH